MTTIKSSFTDRTLEVRDDAGDKNLVIHSGAVKGDLGITVKTADLLAALNAVPESDLFEAGEAYAKQAEELRVAETECDALAKTVERVRELREEARRTEARSGLGYISQVTEWFHKLDAALDPEPAFVLPTEPGSVIIATFDCIDTIYTKPIRRLRNGGWSTLDEKQIFMDSDCIKEWKPAKVVEA